MENDLAWRPLSARELFEISSRDKWKILSQNIFIAWTPNILYAYRDLIDWPAAARNHGIPWDIKLIGQFSEYLEEANCYRNALNTYVRSNLELILQYKDQLDWVGIVDSFGINWTVEAYLECEDYILEAVIAILDVVRPTSFIEFSWYFDSQLIKVMREC